MQINYEWKDYKIIATGDGEKFEKWKDVYLIRPDPQVIWKKQIEFKDDNRVNAVYHRVGGGGSWTTIKTFPSEWKVSWRDLSFLIKPMGFKHTGLFPEQAINWSKMIDIIRQSDRKIKVLNLFAYTGGASVACASAGAFVTHVDSAKNMVERAKLNAKLSNIDEKLIRYIVDDCKKFVQREIRRGNKYDAIIMDPPSYGRGPTGEMWKIEENLFDLLLLCKEILSDEPVFFLINSYTTGLQPTVIKNLMYRAINLEYNFIEAYEVGLPTEEKIILPCGCSAFYYKKKSNS